VPPINRSPLFPDAFGKFPTLNTMHEDQEIVAFNEALLKLRDNFVIHHSDVTAWLLDEHSIFETVLDHPQKFEQTRNLHNLTDACPAYALYVLRPLPLHQRSVLYILHAREPINLTSELVKTVVATNCMVSHSGPPDVNLSDSTCGVPLKEYFWLAGLHPTYVIHNATAALMVSDCFGQPVGVEYGVHGRRGSGYCSCKGYAC